MSLNPAGAFLDVRRIYLFNLIFSKKNLDITDALYPVPGWKPKNGYDLGAPSPDAKKREPKVYKAFDLLSGKKYAHAHSANAKSHEFERY